MKCFHKGSINSPLLQFSYDPADQNDFGDCGDGGGIPVFTFYSITSHGITIFTNIALIIYKLPGSSDD